MTCCKVAVAMIPFSAVKAMMFLKDRKEMINSRGVTGLTCSKATKEMIIYSDKKALIFSKAMKEMI